MRHKILNWNYFRITKENEWNYLKSQLLFNELISHKLCRRNTLQNADCYRHWFCTIILIIHTREKANWIFIFSSHSLTRIYTISRCYAMWAPRRHFKKLKFMQRENYKLQFIMFSFGNGVRRLFIVSLMGTRIFNGALAQFHTLPLLLEKLTKITSCYH